MKDIVKKYKIIIIVSILAISNLFNLNCKNLIELNTNDLKTFNLRGKVKKFSDKIFIARDSFGILTKEHLLFDNYSKEFDTLGYLQSFFDGNNTKKLFRKYNENGQILELYYVGLNGINHIYNNYKYDRFKNLIEYNSFQENGKFYEKHIYKYNDQMNIIEENAYDSIGKLLFRLKYDYNVNNKLSQIQCYNSDRYVKWKELYTYNTNGYSVKYYDTYDTKDFTISKFDNDGNQIENIDKHKNRKLWTYNNIGSILDYSEYYNDNTLKRKEINKYDKFNNLIEKKIIDLSIYHVEDNDHEYLEKIEQYEYQYDSNGNWVIKFDYVFNRITERTIEYYK